MYFNLSTLQHFDRLNAGSSVESGSGQRISAGSRQRSFTKLKNSTLSILLTSLLVFSGCLKVEYSPLDSSRNTTEGLIALLIPFIPKGSQTTSNNTPPSTLSYSGTPYAFMQGVAITTQTPTYSGTVTSCTSSPALPAGLVIANTTCAISGTPTAIQAATPYTITASNAFGSTTFDINITVNVAVTTYQTNCATWQGVVTGEANASSVLPAGGGAAGQSWGLTDGETMNEDAAWSGYLNFAWATARGGSTTISSNVLEFTDRNAVTMTFIGTPAYQTAMCFTLETRDSAATHRMRVTLSDGTTFMQTQTAGGSLEFGFNSPNNITSVVITCVDSDCANQFAIGDLWHKQNP